MAGNPRKRLRFVEKLIANARAAHEELISERPDWSGGRLAPQSDPTAHVVDHADDPVVSVWDGAVRATGEAWGKLELLAAAIAKRHGFERHSAIHDFLDEQVEFDGDVARIGTFCRLCEIPPVIAYMRHKLGWEWEDILLKPLSARDSQDVERFGEYAERSNATDPSKDDEGAAELEGNELAE